MQLSISPGAVLVDGVPTPVAGGPWVLGSVQDLRVASDFAAAPNTAFPLVVGDLIGQGVGQTILTIKPSSSTHKAPTGGTNQLYLLRSSPGATDKEWSGLTLLGTDQGSAYTYNGFVLDHTVRHHAHDLLIKGIPGYKNYPPGETFMGSGWHDTDTLLENVEFDGAGIAAAPMGANSSIRPTWRNIYAHDCPFSTVTFWDTDTITVDGLRSVNNWFGLNFENDRGPVRVSNAFLSPTLANPIAMHIRIDSSQADNPDMEFRNVTWANGVGGGKTLRVGIGDFYHDFTPQQNVIRNFQTSLPKFYNAAGKLMQWADAGNGMDPAGRTKNGMTAPYVPPSHMADALADPTNWVVRHH